MSFHIQVGGGSTLRLPTAGKYCEQNILVSGTGHSDADLQAKYLEGVSTGEAAAAQQCAARHFVGSFTGDGSLSASFHVPFEPDELQIFTFYPFLLNNAIALIEFCYDRRAFGLLAGAVYYTSSKNTTHSITFSTATMPKRYDRAEDGTITIHDVGTEQNPIYFGKELPYTVVAVQYETQTDAERITAFINSLTGSGTVTLNRAKVDAALTEEAWAKLIAAAPNWTFTFI